MKPWSEVVLAKSSGGLELARHASAEASRPAASVGGGGKPLGSAGISWRREGRLAPRIGSALRSSSGRAALVPGGDVVGFAPSASTRVTVLRETVVPSEATPSRGSARAAKELSNPAPAPGGSPPVRRNTVGRLGVRRGVYTRKEMSTAGSQPGIRESNP